jgi:hypothetical protein
MGRNFLAYATREAINAVLPAVGYNSAFSSEGSGFFAPSSWRPSGRHYARRNRTSSHATAPSM